VTIAVELDLGFGWEKRVRETNPPRSYLTRDVKWTRRPVRAGLWNDKLLSWAFRNNPLCTSRTFLAASLVPTELITPSDELQETHAGSLCVQNDIIPVPFTCLPPASSVVVAILRIRTPALRRGGFRRSQTRLESGPDAPCGG